MNNSNKKIYESGSFTLDSAEHILSLDGEIIPLTPKVFDTLLILIENSGHLVEKDELMEKVWPDTIVEEANLAKNISILRKVLSNGGLEDSFIETVPKLGYRFIGPVKEIKTFKSEEKSQKDVLPTKNNFTKVKYLIMPLVLLATVIGFGIWYFSNGEKPIESVAVLPFKTVNGNEKLDDLSDSLTEGLINHLSNLSQLKVIARHSSFKYKGKDIDISEVGNTLNVQTIVIGEIAQNNEDLTIKIEIVDAQEKTQLLSKRYERKAKDLIKIQREIAQTISEKLRVQLTNEQEQTLAKRGTDNPDAYQNYLNGMYHLRNYTEKGRLQKSLDSFKKAIELDPNYADAHAMAAYIYIHKAYASPENSIEKEELRLSKKYVDKAIEIDNSSANAHAISGKLKWMEWDFAGAEQAFNRAVELNPNLAIVNSHYASFLSTIGKHKEALEVHKRIESLDPLFYQLKVGEASILLVARRYDESLKVIEELAEIEPTHRAIYHARRFCYAGKGMYEEALSANNKKSELHGKNTFQLTFSAWVYAKWGKRDKALSILEKLKTAKAPVSLLTLARVYAELGEKDTAFEFLEESFKKHDLLLVEMRNDPEFDNLRDDPRFKDLLKRIGFPEI
jgi:TolB-like protein/DNA-binding winged helix-turn-helix (wHTH) protein/Flp pilus assembly protein TadD